MGSPFGSITTPADTDPVIDGGTYMFEVKDASGEVVAIETGIIMGTWRDLITGRTEGNLYHFKRGSQPFRVCEGTASMAAWTLVSAPSKTAATHARNAYKAKKEAEAQAKLDAAEARKAS